MLFLLGPRHGLEEVYAGFNAVFEEELESDWEEIEGCGGAIDGTGEIGTVEELENGEVGLEGARGG